MKSFSDVFPRISGNKIYNDDISANEEGMSSLKGSPETIEGNFDCSYNLLKNLEGSPKEIGGYFDCSFNKLTSLEGCTKKINGKFDCRNNRELKNIKQQLIDNEIIAEMYYTDEGTFSKSEIEKLIIIKNGKDILNKHKNKDYGLSL